MILMTQLCIPEPGLWKFVGAIRHVLATEHTELEELPRGQLRLKCRVEVSSNPTCQLVVVAVLHQVVYPDDSPAHSGETTVKDLFAIVEDSLELSLYQRMSNPAECPERKRIDDDVFYCCASLTCGETVGVDPFRIRAAKLRVLEREWGVPFGDLGSPAHWQTIQTDRVVDQRANFHRDWRCRVYAEAQLGRRDQLEVFCCREEGEHLMKWLWNPRASFDAVFFHSFSV